jgi:hypothetical protein
MYINRRILICQTCLIAGSDPGNELSLTLFIAGLCMPHRIRVKSVINRMLAKNKCKTITGSLVTFEEQFEALPNQFSDQQGMQAQLNRRRIQTGGVGGDR